MKLRPQSRLLSHPAKLLLPYVDGALILAPTIICSLFRYPRLRRLKKLPQVLIQISTLSNQKIKQNNKRFGSLWWGSTYVLVTIGEGLT